MQRFKEYEKAFGIVESRRLADEAWRHDLRQEFPDLPDELYELCFQRAWERAQSKGYDAVYDDLLYVIEFAAAIMDFCKRDPRFVS